MCAPVYISKGCWQNRSIISMSTKSAPFLEYLKRECIIEIMFLFGKKVHDEITYQKPSSIRIYRARFFFIWHDERFLAPFFILLWQLDWTWIHLVGSMMIYLHLMQLEFGVTKAISHRLYYIETPFSNRKKIDGKKSTMLCPIIIQMKSKQNLINKSSRFIFFSFIRFFR